MNELISGLRGFKFNDVHNNTIGAVMHSKLIQPPSKKKIKESVPFMNGSYDFSTISSNGQISYSERKITISLGLPANNKEHLQVLYSSVLEWLEDCGKQKLIFDVVRDYYYMAEIEDVSSFEETMEFGKLELTFVADPFKHSVEYVGSDVWDTFNFEEDYAQDVEHTISGSKSITIYNPRRPVRPTIECNSSMSIIQNGTTYNLISGTNKPYNLYLNTGANNITVNGTGTIKFIFRKESI